VDYAGHFTVPIPGGDPEVFAAAAAKLDAYAAQESAPADLAPPAVTPSERSGFIIPETCPELWGACCGDM